MIKKTILFFLVLISIPTFGKIGINRNYSIISHADYNKRQNKGQDILLCRCIVIPNYNKNFKEIMQVKDQNLLLATFSFMLRKNKQRKMEEYIFQCDTSIEINNLLCGLYYFSLKDYRKALDYFEKYKNLEFQFLKYLLVADCNYELLENKKNYKLILELYQAAFDISKNEQNQSIINNRIKFIKYRS